MAAGRRRRDVRNGGGQGRGRGGQSAKAENVVGAGALGHNASEHCLERFNIARRPKNVTSSKALAGELDLRLNVNVRRYVDDQQRIEETGRDAWLKLSEIPTADEICLPVDVEIELVPNKIKGKWKSTDKYLHAQYALLREDAISPLRDAVDRFRKNPNMTDDNSVSIYEKVHIIGFTFAQLGIAARIKFSTIRAGRRISWQSSKRLVSGSIIALSPANDKFKEKCIIALVAARPLQGVQLPVPEIDIYFTRSEDIEIDPQREWIMVEARQGYYEAYRHTLRALQKLSQESFPLSEHICSLATEIEPPNYLKNSPVIDLSPATQKHENATYVHVDVLQNWPPCPQDTLDATQWSSIQQILTKSFALIKGPPGTGKTHVSKIALEILTHQGVNKGGPIIIAAQTNHALDQLLGHISTFEPNYIRVGGRSTDLNVKKRALFEVRKAEKIPNIPGGILCKSLKEWKMQSKALATTLEPLHQTDPEPFSIQTFLDYGIITEKQCQSLEAGARRWVSSRGDNNGPLQLWLNRGLIPFEVQYKAEDFDLDEDEDLEFEQLKEHEAEHGINDEEDVELLRGEWSSVYDKFTIHNPNQSHVDKAKEMLNSLQDFWKVPEALRGPMYLVMQQRLKDRILIRFRREAVDYAKIVYNLKIGKWERDAVYLQRARIVGMTTTGLSKYRSLISSLKPKIILIEEAAEIIEAPVTVACMESLEHLILVGDDQQLQGHCSVMELEGEPYYHNVSLFERMVRNKIPFKTLLRQRRMNPEFRKLISVLYPDLEDHPTVIDRHSPPWGMGEVKSFFFTHDWPENKDSQMSTYNAEEAKFVAGFYRYLVRNNVSPQAVTILTFYNGQRKRILKEIRAFPELVTNYSTVKTVDSYQGEENAIVLLSLVRSNSYGKIGFLKSSNRVCVALSRAKFGFYLFGNATLLARYSPLWQNVIGIMSAKPVRLGEKLPLKCERHQQEIEIQYADEWNENDGGCKEVCGMQLPCGHPCNLKCHVFPHSHVICDAKCTRKLNCGHNCGKWCHKMCFCNCSEFTFLNLGPGDSGGLTFNLLPRAKIPQCRSETLPTAISGSGPSQHGNLRINGGRQQQLSDTVFPRLPASGKPRSQPHLDDPFIEDRIARGSFSTQPSKPSNTTSAMTNHFMNDNLMPPEKQVNKLQDWNHYAEGGVKADDELRAQSVASPSEEEAKRVAEASELLLDLPPSNNTSLIKDETSCVMAGGRTKFTQDYQPAASRGQGGRFSPYSVEYGDGRSSKQSPPENLLD